MRSFSYGALVLLLAAQFGTGLLAVQEQEPEVDYDEQQYADYQAAVNEPDLAERQKKILAFIEANPKLSLVKYAIQSLREVVGKFYQQQKWPEAIGAAQAWLKLEPDATAAHALIAEAAFQQQDFKTAAEHGEKFYEGSPSPQMAYLLAIAFQQLKNDEKFVKFGKTVIAGYEPKDYTNGHFQILDKLRGIAASRSDWSAAADYSRKILTGFEQAKLPEGWGDYVDKEKAVSYGFLGRHAYEVGRWNEAISNYNKVIAGSSDRNQKAEAYYYIGIGNWRANRLDPAMESFARGSLLRGAPHQDACNQYLVTLYKSTHNGSTAGLDEYMERITGRP